MARGLTQEDAAQWLGIYRRTTVDWEAGGGRCVPKIRTGCRKKSQNVSILL